MNIRFSEEKKHDSKYYCISVWHKSKQVQFYLIREAALDKVPFIAVCQPFQHALNNMHVLIQLQTIYNKS